MSERLKSDSDTVDTTGLHTVADEATRADALADPDAQPMTEQDLPLMPLVPRTITLRRAMKLTQQQFGERYRIPVETLRDWEQRRTEPDAIARAYLHVIASEPEMVRKTLEQRQVAAE